MIGFFIQILYIQLYNYKNFPKTVIKSTTLFE